MARVLKHGGVLGFTDNTVPPQKQLAGFINHFEKLRDPSHARSLALVELQDLFRTAGLGAPRESFYELRDEVKNLLARSFPNPGDEAKIIDLFHASIADDRLGIPVRRDGDRLEYAYPVAILAAERR